MTRLHALLRRVVDVRDEELKLLFWSFVCFFCLLCGYYILRPIRSELGIRDGFQQLPKLTIATLVVTLALNPVFSALVARFPARRLVPLVFRFVIANLLVFYLLFLRLGFDTRPLAVAFYVWLSAINLMIVSLFWSLMADVFRREQGKRLFGVIAAGGSVGAIVGGLVTAELDEWVGTATLFLFSALLLEGVSQCARQLIRVSPPYSEATPRRPDKKARILDGILLVLRSPYLMLICLYIILFTTTSTFAWFIVNQAIAEHDLSSGERKQLYAYIDVFASALTLFLQVVLTGRIIVVLGVGVALVSLPAIYLMGLSTLYVWPLLWVVLVFEVLRRAFNYSLAKAGREVLFTVLSDDAKYKSKNLIDAFMYRTGDTIAALGFWAGEGLAMSIFALIALPISLVWGIVGFYLGEKQAQYRDPREAPSPVPAGPIPESGEAQ